MQSFGANSQKKCGGRFFIVSVYVVGTHLNRLGKAIQMSTNNNLFMENYGTLFEPVHPRSLARAFAVRTHEV